MPNTNSSDTNDGSTSTNVQNSTSGSAASWTEYFPYESPYGEQAEAIERIRAVAQKQGYLMFEGACGTGKTLAAYMGGLDLIDDPDSQYERMVVLTPYKQQLRVFVEDLRAVNEHQPEGGEFSALTMVSKADLCPYVSTGTLDEADIYRRCETVREGVQEPIQGEQPQAKYGRLQGLVNTADADSSRASLAAPPESGADWESPFQQDIPSQGSSEFCPFYANLLQYSMEQDDYDGYHPQGVVNPEDIMEVGAEDGYCPHKLMQTGIDNVDVAVGNYQHLFDDLTFEAMTEKIFGPETLLICDEAHMLVPRVRDLLGDSLAESTLSAAVDEVHRDVQDATGKVGAYIHEQLEEAGIDGDDIEVYAHFLEELGRQVDKLGEKAAEEADPEFDRAQDIWDLPDEITFPLREPDRPQTDHITDWASLAGYTNIFAEIGDIGTAISDALEEASTHFDSFYRAETDAEPVGRVLGRWYDLGHDEYYRQLTLRKRTRKYDDGDGWRQYYTAHIEIKNCIPSERIAEKLSRVGSAVLMSATLAPMDAYKNESGLAVLEENGHTVESYVSSGRFNTGNRASLIADLPAFTYDNQSGAVAEEYADAITDVVTTTDGNVLVAMPSYRMAEWAAERLQSHPDVDVPPTQIRADESSSDAETERLKEWFFSGDKKVIATGLRGTLTTGVDYDGDKLAAVAVAGVPIRNLRSDYTTAIQTAYEGRYGEDDGFEYAFTIPAVRRSRQALGRVIRGENEVGTRVLLDSRYLHSGQQGVQHTLPQYEREEYDAVQPDKLSQKLDAFWKSVEQ